MIKKLKRRFLIIIMSIFTVVILGIATVIFVLMLNSETKASQQVIEYAISDYSKGFKELGKLIPPENKTDIPEFFDKTNIPDDVPADIPDNIPDNFSSEMNENKNYNDIFPNNTHQNPNSMFRNWISIDIDKNGEVCQIYRSMNQFDSDDNTSDDADALSEISLGLFENGKKSGNVTINDIQYRYLIREVFGDKTRIVLLDRSIEIATLQRLAVVIGITAVIALIFVYILSIFLSRWAVRPIEKAWLQQKEFIANASHELKTPLTVISANADVIMSNPDETVETQMQWFGYIKDEINKMSKLVSSMLYIAKEDSNEEKIIMSEFNGSDVVEGAVLAFEALIFENDKIIETDIEPDLNMHGDKERINQLMHILIDNAVSHSAQNGFITIRFYKHKSNKIRIEVSNNGEIIPTEDLPRLFDRYYRTDKSHNHNTGGFGLGLSIAKAIVDKHNGTISASCTPSGITTFTVTIPNQ